MPNTFRPPLVSVLMPAYNHAPYVRAAVESVLGQTYDNLELIAIDDASSDATWTVLQSFDDERLRLHRHDTNQGAHATLNEALKLAKGEFIAIINSDDMYHPERLARLVAEAERSNGKDTLIFTDVSFVDAQGSTVEAHPRVLGYKALNERCASLAPYIRLLTGNLAVSTSNFFFSRLLAEKVGAIAPLRYTHDWDWALRASLYGPPTWVRESLLSYRIHVANTLSEDDSWRHIHENSYIQAKALLMRGQGVPEHEEPLAAARSASLALLENESFHPLALSLYLTCLLGGVDDNEMLELSCTRDGNWMLKELADAASCPADLFRSVGYLAEREKVVMDQKVMIEERWNIIHNLSEEIAKRDTCIAAQTELIEERWHIIQTLSEEVAKRDTCIAAQTELIEEKDRGIAAQTELIEEKDRGIASQTELIEERWHIIQTLSEEIAKRDTSIAAQTELIEEKDRGSVAQALLIDERDRYINELHSEIADQRNRTAGLEGELADLYGSRVVRMAMAIRRRLHQLARLGSTNR